MLSEWTSREKKLLLTSCILALLLVSMLVSSWVKKEDALSPEFMAQSFTGQMGHHDSGPHHSVSEHGKGDDLSGEQHEINKEIATEVKNEAEEVIVDIKGAVHRPYVYGIKADRRVIDVIDQAGGLLETASTDTINLAQKVFDGMVIYIPTEEEVLQNGGASETLATFLTHNSSNNQSQGGTDTSGKVNINTATATELETLPGIGPSRAKAIISYREEQGFFTSPEDLMNVSGIGPKIFANLKEEIVVR